MATSKQQPTTPTPVVQIRIFVGGKVVETSIPGNLVALKGK